MSLELRVAQASREEEQLCLEDATALLEGALPLEELLAAAELPRRRHFSNRVRVHILNNIKNGHCAEDCGYCAQRRTAPEEVPAYTTKSDEEILAEARLAKSQGAFRYCLVQSGRGPGPNTVRSLARVISRIKGELGLEVCLSAGILTDSESARTLADAGLDRYNHNLNTSAEHYGSICTTHTYQDRVDTLGALSSAGVRLCSGVIAGMGETPADLASAGCELRRLGAASVPVNFFLPVLGHAVASPNSLTQEYCLRILCVYRLLNPRAEVRLAAGREFHLRERQPDALRVANSLFVSGYLNVRGSNAAETFAMLEGAGFVPEASGEYHGDGSEAAEFPSARSAGSPADRGERASLTMKDEGELRPFAPGRS